MKCDGAKLTVDEFSDRLQNTSIDKMYDFLRCDYGSIKALNKNPTDVDFELPFRTKFDWKREPSIEEVCRLFNQINTFYTEKMFMSDGHMAIDDLLVQGNELLLYRQNKTVGIRKKNIEYGVKKHLPIGDPFRSYKWFLGIDPKHLASSLRHWTNAFKRANSSLDSAILLMMTLLTIHPFSDANGRLGRIIFTYFLKSRRLPVLYLNEHVDGELLRIGQGIHSTEYLMGAFVSEFASHHNNVDPGRMGFSSDEKSKSFHDKFISNLKRCCRSELAPIETFTQLKNHLQKDHHFAPKSPRFDCLRSFIN